MNNILKEFFMPDKTVHVVVIGGGISGSTTAAEIMKNAPCKTQVTIIEQLEGRLGGGVAYGQSSANVVHQTNTEADRMVQAITGNAAAVLPQIGIAGNQVMSRHTLGKVMLNELFSTASRTSMLCGLKSVYGEVVDITDNAKADKVTIDMKDGTTIIADRVVIATGNNDHRSLPASKTPDRNDADFAARYVDDQWVKKGQDQIAAVPKDEPVMIIGTALSAYDAARTLLANGHTGKITMVSRHALEHYQFPQYMNRPASFSLQEPRFASMLDNPKAALKEMLIELRELTGLTVDLEKDTIEPKNWRSMYTKGMDSEFYQPGLILWAWERHIPAVIAAIGIEEYGNALKKHTSLINVLRMGAGWYACEEIEAAKRTGQLEVIAADIEALVKNDKGGITAGLTETETGAKRTLDAHTVISSLGPNHDYARTKSALWNSLMKKGYTKPHPIGFGVCVDTAKCPGALPGSDKIFVAGTPASGDLMQKGIIGPPAFSVPMMHPGTVATAQYICSTFAKAATPGKQENDTAPITARIVTAKDAGRRYKR